MTKHGDLCTRTGCRGTLKNDAIPLLDPAPREAFTCDGCGNTLLIVHEAGFPVIEVWLIDLGFDESFREFIDRTRRGEGGPGDIHL